MGGATGGTTAAIVNPAGPARSSAGRFGVYGGRYVPETLMAALEELEAGLRATRKNDPAFQRRARRTSSATTCGRPTPLYFAERLTETLGGAKIYLKREDLLHTGAHKINNALGQVLLARRMGKTAHHRRDRRRPARRRHRHRLRAVRHGMRHLHGRRGHARARSSTSFA